MTNKSDTRSLSKHRVLITRPAEQQQGLCEAIESYGGQVICCPLMEILAITDDLAVREIKVKIQNLDRYDLLIFISTNAVRHGANWIADYWPQFPLHTKLFGIGPSTAQCITEELQLAATSSPAGMTSEDLLALAELNAVENKRVGIVRGKGGRELLADALRQRGAEVDYLEVYSRNTVAYDGLEFLETLLAGAVNTLAINSAESLQRLAELINSGSAQSSSLASAFTDLPLVVPSSRVARLASQLGFTQVFNAQGADDQACVAALQSLADKAKK